VLCVTLTVEPSRKNLNKENMGGAPPVFSGRGEMWGSLYDV